MSRKTGPLVARFLTFAQLHFLRVQRALRVAICENNLAHDHLESRLPATSSKLESTLLPGRISV